MALPGPLPTHELDNSRTDFCLTIERIVERLPGPTVKSECRAIGKEHLGAAPPALDEKLRNRFADLECGPAEQRIIARGDAQVAAGGLGGGCHGVAWYQMYSQCRYTVDDPLLMTRRSQVQILPRYVPRGDPRDRWKPPLARGLGRPTGRAVVVQTVSPEGARTPSQQPRCPSRTSPRGTLRLCPGG